ncbi:hypothetical protein GCM10022221_07140 [Actinocorallia aurea]
MESLPEYCADLSNEVAERHLTVEFLKRNEDLPVSALDASSVPLGRERRWETTSLRRLCDEAMKRFADDIPAADAWMAPRLHATLRLTRSEAANAGLWNHLALRVAPDYVFWRHPGRTSGENAGVTSRERFSGPSSRQAFARLWWAAEMFRDGYDYEPVVTACRSQDITNTFLKVEIIRHRPTAQAILRLVGDGTAKTSDELNALSKVLNAAGMTLVYEALAPDAPPDVEAYRAWIEDRESANIPWDTLPDGPDDGRAPLSAVNTLVPLFRRLFEERPGAGKPSGTLAC